MRKVPLTLTLNKRQGTITAYLRATNISDAVEAAVNRKKQKLAKKNKKAQLHATN
jgi:hypothetical protein